MGEGEHPFSRPVLSTSAAPKFVEQINYHEIEQVSFARFLKNELGRSVIETFCNILSNRASSGRALKATGQEP
jgi:hypothetical protein